MKRIDYHPEIFVMEDFLSAAECEDLINKADKIGFEEAKVQVGEGKQSMMKNVRNNERILYPDPQLAADLWERVRPFAVPVIGLYTACGLNDMFRFYKYAPGQRFKMLRDGSYVRNDSECSFYTFLLYLNDDFEGGETEFQDIVTINPRKGALLVFHHPLRHEGKLLLSGHKYALRSDIMYKLSEESI